MPKGMKPSPNFKGNKNSGDKPDSVKFAEFINMGIANEIGNQELKRIKSTPTNKRKREDLKEIVMPVVLKGIVERKDITSLGEKITPIYGGKSIETNELPKV